MQNFLKIILLSISIFSLYDVKAQKSSMLDDLDSYKKTIESRNNKIDRDLSYFNGRYLFNKEDNIIVKYNPLCISIGGMLFIYDNTLAPIISSPCLFSPSCALFFRKSLFEYGFFKALFISTDRISKCSRLSSIDIKRSNMFHNKAIDPISFYSLKHYNNE
ncbi:MAG: membrane protein insertion efficiency factor YidD [Marinifilaceae bacterium]|jgi:putative component of membrane protein insertase Oxa1/YidC/SpoIIIJ protein YidD|nr:membrane protein insertion efficiency factor YidD [Marinifilaceae bacterium]